MPLGGYHRTTYLVGFDAGDEIKGTTVQNQVSSHQNLENVNIFRIDGNW